MFVVVLSLRRQPSNEFVTQQDKEERCRCPFLKWKCRYIEVYIDFARYNRMFCMFFWQDPISSKQMPKNLTQNLNQTPIGPLGIAEDFFRRACQMLSWQEGSMVSIHQRSQFSLSTTTPSLFCTLQRSPYQFMWFSSNSIIAQPFQQNFMGNAVKGFDGSQHNGSKEAPSSQTYATASTTSTMAASSHPVCIASAWVTTTSGAD